MDLWSRECFLREVAFTMRTIMACGLALCMAGGVAGQTQPDSLPPGVTTEMIAEGATLFLGQGICMACHGSDAKGLKGMGANLTDDEWTHTDGTFEGIVERITAGVTAKESSNGLVMPPRGAGLNDDQVRAVAAYVWSLSRSRH